MSKLSDKCKNCGKIKGVHKAIGGNCPIGRGNHPQFKNSVFEPKSIIDNLESMFERKSHETRISQDGDED